jgi:hypothetical protein
MGLPKSCRASSTIEVVELKIYFAALTKLESCPDSFKPAWESVKKNTAEQVGGKIEEISLDLKFSTLTISQLDDVIQKVKDEVLPINYSKGPTENFALRIDTISGKLGALVSIASTCKAAFLLPSGKMSIGDFHYIIRAQPKAAS